MLKRSVIFRWRGGALGAVMIIAVYLIMLSACNDANAPNDAVREPPRQVVRLPDGMSDEARRIYNHHTEMDPESGTGLFPWVWVQALNDLETGRPFMENYERFGLIRDTDEPEQLPVGFGVTNEFLGVNCAVCHVGQLDYEGQRIIVTGAPNVHDAYENFLLGLIETLVATLTDDRLRESYFSRILGAEVKTDEHVRLQGEIEAWLAPFLGDNTVSEFAFAITTQNLLSSVFGTSALEGTHAFELSRPTFFGPENEYTTQAKVDTPPIWGLQFIQNLHYNGNTNSIIERNLISALNTYFGGDLNMILNTDPHRLNEIELAAWQIKVPAWPEEVLGAIDPQLTQQGEALYAQHCAACHATTYPTERTTLPTFPAEEIGTDMLYFEVFDQPIVNFNGVAEQPYDQALRKGMDIIKAQWLPRYNMSPEEVQTIEAGEAPWWKFERVWVAEPLAGIWASAPYLHNRSVPTLYHLLLPPEERPQTFPLGHFEYDPKLMGFRTDIQSDDPNYVGSIDTSAEGQSNAGHEYGTNLSDEERISLIEYLKTLR